jgi:EmrB/QacA subfamily drug resistance transporter
VSTAAGAARQRQHYHVTLIVLVMSAMAYALQQTLVSPALPTIQADMHVSTTAVTYLLTAFLLSASVATPVVGRLGDMFGKKRMLVWTLAVFGVGSLVSALSSSIGMMIAGRTIQGVGGAVFPLAYGIVRDEFPRQKVAGAIGLISATMGVGGAVGVVLSGVIVDHLGYPSVFWLGLAFTAATAVMTQLFVPESELTVPARIDWVGAGLLSAGMVALLIGVSEGNTWGWGSSRVLALFAAAVVLLVTWGGFENRHPAPLVDMAMMRRRAVLTTNLSAVLIGFGLYSIFILFPKFVQTPSDAGYGFGANVTQAGLFLLPNAAAMLVAGPFAGWLSGRYGSRLPLLLGALMVQLCFALVTLEHSEPWMIYLASGLGGAGIGFAFAAMPNLIIQAVEPSRTGVATGMNAIMRTVGGAIGAQICAAILMGHPAASGRPTEQGFLVCFVLLALVVGGAMVCVLAIPAPARRRRSPVTSTAAAPLRAPAVFGRVRRCDGDGVPAAVLAVLGDDGRQVAWTRADLDGHYRMDLAGPGRYLIVAADGGRDPQAVEVLVDGRPAELEITLSRHRSIPAPPRAAVFALGEVGPRS